jgi:hypothetical protein
MYVFPSDDYSMHAVCLAWSRNRAVSWTNWNILTTHHPRSCVSQSPQQLTTNLEPQCDQGG